MTAPRPIYSYESARQFLLDTLAHAQSSDPGHSVRKWARDMGLPSHTLLVMLLQGKRPLRVKHASFLAKGLKLSFQEKLYLQALIQFESAETAEEKQLCSLWLADLNPGRDFKTRELEEWETISHWIHGAILAMSTLADCPQTPKGIASRLKGAVTAAEVSAALERLARLELIERDAVTGRLRPTCNRLTSRNDFASEGVRRYHKGVMELAARALEQVPLEQREFQAFSFAVRADRVALAKEMIRKFRSQLVQAVGADDDEGDEVYQMNLQFFQLTERPASAEYEGAGTEQSNEGVLQ